MALPDKPALITRPDTTWITRPHDTQPLAYCTVASSLGKLLEPVIADLSFQSGSALVWHQPLRQLKNCNAVPPGQLAGSLAATLFARLLKAGALHALPAAGMQACPMLVSALLLAAAGQAVASLKPLHPSPASKTPGSTRKVQEPSTCLLGCMLWCVPDKSVLKSRCCGLLHGRTATP